MYEFSKKVVQSIRTVALLSLICLASGCASIKSRNISGKTPVPKGLVYYLPTQHLTVTLTVLAAASGEAAGSKSPTRTVEVVPTTVFADLGARYVLTYHRNHVGNSKALVKIGINGLLEGESSGATTSKLKEIGQGIATSAAALESINRDGTQVENSNACAVAGIYRWTISVDGLEVTRPYEARSARRISLSDCGLSVMPVQLSDAIVMETNIDVFSGRAGVFYRQSLPYTIQVDDIISKVTSSFVMTLVSSRSPRAFLPIPKTVFSNVNWKLTFDDGMPTVYDIDANSDILGLVTLPADIIAEYSKAITAGFTTRKSELDADAAYLKALTAIATQRVAADACRIAVSGGDPDKIKEACK